VTLRTCFVTASINELSNLGRLRSQLAQTEHTNHIIVIDEGNYKIRAKNRELLKDLNIEFYGPRERISWFKKRFGSAYRRYLSVIPQKCHAETSFGFLVAWEEQADVIIELDDDVKPIGRGLFVEGHVENLFSNTGVTLHSKSKWYNTIDALEIDERDTLFPRGHPYGSNARSRGYTWKREPSRCVLNMGLWSGCPDFDALTIFEMGCFDGRPGIRSEGAKVTKLVPGRGTYFAVCSMNISFRREVVPSYYQLYMKYRGVDRFDDIWSGIFLKKIADHLGDAFSLGRPVVFHDKRPRNVFNDMRVEFEGMVINESLWRMVDSIQLEGDGYFQCYSELIDALESNMDKIRFKPHRNFLKFQAGRMKLWLKAIDGL
jgi:hypothetical protein